MSISRSSDIWIERFGRNKIDEVLLPSFFLSLCVSQYSR